MKKISIFLVFICSVCHLVNAQNMASIFSSMPDRMILPFDSIQRLDIIDLYNAGRSPQIVNHFGDTAKLVVFHEDYLQIKSGNMQLEIALLPMVNDSKIIAVVKSVCSPVCDSKILFYTTEWKSLNTDIFITPVTQTWFFADGIDRNDEYFKSFENALDLELMQFSFENHGLTLVQTYNTPQYLSPDIRKKADKYLKKESKKYTWNQVRYQ